MSLHLPKKADSSIPMIPLNSQHSRTLSLARSPTSEFYPEHSKSLLGRVPEYETEDQEATSDQEETRALEEEIDLMVRDQVTEDATLTSGRFERPDRKEILGYLIAAGFVVLLAIAAGLTTIYDWVV